MTAFVGLLRAVNVGGRNLIMTDLKAVADGTYAGSLENGQRIVSFAANTPFAALEFATVGATSGTSPAP